MSQAGIVGEFSCGNCGDTVPLKKDTKGKFYYVCRCGQHFMRGRDGADVVLEKGVIFGAAAPVAAAPVADPVAAVRNVTESPAPVRSVTPPPPPPPRAAARVANPAAVTVGAGSQSDYVNNTFF